MKSNTNPRSRLSHPALLFARDVNGGVGRRAVQTLDRLPRLGRILGMLARIAGASAAGIPPCFIPSASA